MSSKGKVPKTLVIGAKGFLGRHFFQAYKQIYPDSIGIANRKQLDLKQPHLERLDDLGYYEYAVITAGITNIAKCEKDPPTTRLCNVTGTLELVNQLHQKKIVPILFSSDYVYDGVIGNYDEDSPLNPLNEYGRQKADLQNGLNKICGKNFLLIRPSKVFGQIPGDGTLLDEIATKLRNNETILAAYDQIFCPITVTNLVEGVIELQKINCRGIFNICGQKLTRFQIAEEVAKKLGAKPTLIKPISLEDLKEPFIRPKNTSMRCDKFQSLTGFTLRTIEDCINDLTDSH